MSRQHCIVCNKYCDGVVRKGGSILGHMIVCNDHNIDVLRTQRVEDLYRCIECWKLSRIREDKTVPLCNECRNKAKEEKK